MSGKAGRKSAATPVSMIKLPKSNKSKQQE